MMGRCSLLGWGLGRCASFAVCVVVLGLVFVAGATWLGLVAMGGSELVCLGGFALFFFVLDW